MAKNHWCCFHCKVGFAGLPLKNVMDGGIEEMLE
jgi:hypothetical protein